MDILAQSALLVAITSFALGISVLAKNAKNKLFLAFAVLTVLISAWATAFFFQIYLQSRKFYLIHLFCNFWLAPAGLVFVRELVRIRTRTSRRLLEFGIVLCVGLSIALTIGWARVHWVRMLIYFAPGLIAIQTFELIWVDGFHRTGALQNPKLSTIGVSANRRTWLYLGALFVLATSVMDHVPQMGHALPALGNLTLTAYLFFLGQAISQQRFLNFNALLSRFLVLLSIALTLTLLYTLLFAWIKDRPALFLLNSFIVSFLIIMMLDPLRSVVRYFTERLLTKKYRRLQETLREAQRELTGIVEIESLSRSVLNTLEKTLHPEHSAFYVLSSDATRYRKEEQRGTGSIAIQEVIVDQPLLQYCQSSADKNRLAVVLDQAIDNELARSASQTQREFFQQLLEGLKALEANLLIPLMAETRVLAFVVAWVPQPPEPWGNNWGLLPVIYPYFEQAAQSLRNMEVFVRQKERERLAVLGEMAAGLAHEIRNPLGAIKGAAQLLDSDPVIPKNKFLTAIIQEVDRLNAVVTRFLDYSKPLESDFEPLDFGRLVRRCVEFMQPTIPSKVKLDLEIAGTFFVRGSPVQLHQLVFNLIQNSLQAFQRGGRGGRIHIALRQYLDGGCPQVQLIIEDDGPGIKKENIGKIFIPFFTTAPHGTGLGLSICQKIVQSHGGRIEVESDGAKGARFLVSIPVFKEEA